MTINRCPRDGARAHARERSRVSPAALRSVLGLFVTFAIAGVAHAQNPPPVQTYFVPVPEDQVFDGLQSIYPGNATCGGSSPEVADPITTTISVAVEFGNTLVYYDQWEDGAYDPDIANPANVYSSPGNLGGTQIWGDGDATNGAPPGYPGDVLAAGDIIVLSNTVNTGSLSTIDFDGRDKIAASSPVAVTRAAWAAGPSTLLAGAVEVLEVADWGTAYEAPVGQNTPSQLDMFEYTGLVIMASEDGTTVDIDADANGIDETTVNLDAGESYHVDGGVNEGGSVSASAPVQVHQLTGDVCATYESRFFTLVSTDMWSSDAYTPVGTNAGDPSYVFVYNPGPGSITVNWETNTGAQPSALIAAGGTAQFEMPDNTGAHFFTTGDPFFAVSTIDSEPIGNNQAHDWGFSMIPASALTQQALVGWGPGKDPTQAGTENGSPVWVTPVLGTGTSPVAICVDYDGDNVGPLTDPFGNSYDLLLSLDELDAAKVFDPDGDQTGMILYVCDSSDASIAVVWGQDPDTASAGAPAIDVGTTVPPLEALAAGKAITIETDIDLDGQIDQNDVLRFSIVVQNVSRVPITGVVVEDTLPALVTYVANSTELDDGITTTPVPDAGVTDFPLDEGGIALPPVPPGGQITVEFLVLTADSANACGQETIINQAVVTGDDDPIIAVANGSVYCNPDIDIEKSTNGADADTPTGPLIVETGAVMWVYTVTNPGDTPLANVSVVDDQSVTVTPLDANLDTFNDGDTDLDGLLDPGETWIFTASGTAALGQYANIGTVTGTPVDESGTPINDGDGTPFADVTDDDPSHYLGVECLVAGDCNDGVACTVESCVANACVSTPDDAPCNDGQFCNGVETCDPLLDCQAGTPVDCSDATACTIDQCNETTDQCENTPDDSLCSDGEFCNGVETCDPLLGCQAGTAVDCDDGVACTADTCDEIADQCTNVPNDASCDDGLFCNGDETCDALLDCQPGTDPCPGQACDEPSDTCVACLVDADCSDGVACNGAEVCTGGTCQPGTPVVCDDGQACTTDTCTEPSGACAFTPNDAACSDGLFCNGEEVCNPVTGCESGPTVDCSGVVAECGDGFCNETTDACDAFPTDALCDDGLFCNGVEQCDPSNTCQAGTPIDCDDGFNCTSDSCNEAADTCNHTPDDALCQDGAFCNGAEICDPLAGCQAGPPVDCSDGVGCTIDTCNETTDACESAPDDALCDDGAFCNGDETCDALLDCQAGAPPDCSDGVGCTVEACDETLDACTQTPVDALCDDGAFCNGVEVCDPVLDCQAGAAVDCDDGFVCTTDTCDEVGDVCVNDASGCICGDGLPAPGEQCDPPATQGGDPACGDDCLFICGNGVVGDSICSAGIVGAACGTNADCDVLGGDGVCFVEECEPPGPETCNNGIDDDGDGFIDCADVDCQSSQETCGANCQLVPPCGCIFRDPAFVKLYQPPWLDYFKLHGRLLVDPGMIVPEDVGFRVILSNANGVIYDANLPPAELRDFSPKLRWVYKNNLAKDGADPVTPWQGLSRVKMKVRRIQGVEFLAFKIKSYGDYDLATLPEMTTQVYTAGGVSSLTASWRPTKSGFKLTQKDYPPCELP